MKLSPDKSQYVNDGQAARLAGMSRTGWVQCHRDKPGAPVKGPHGYLASEVVAYCEKLATSAAAGDSLLVKRRLLQIELIAGKIHLDNQEKQKRDLELLTKRGEVISRAEHLEKLQYLAQIQRDGFAQFISLVKVQTGDKRLVQIAEMIRAEVFKKMVNVIKGQTVQPIGAAKQ